MRWCMFAVKLLETIVAISIAVLFLIPHEFESSLYNASHVHRVDPESTFCFLQPPGERNESTVNWLLGLAPDATVPKSFSKIVDCLEADEVKNGEKKCFCLNNFWWVAVNVIVAFIIALLSFVYAIFVGLNFLDRATPLKLTCLVICSAIITVCCLLLGSLNIFAMTTYWIYHYQKGEFSANYFNPPTLWWVATGLWACFIFLSFSESVVYVVQIGYFKGSTGDSISLRDCSRRSKSGRGRRTKKSGGIVGKRPTPPSPKVSVSPTTKMPNLRRRSPQSSKYQSSLAANKSKSYSSESSSSSKSKREKNENKSIRLIPHHHHHKFAS